METTSQESRILRQIFPKVKKEKLLIIFDNFGFELAQWASEQATKNHIPFHAIYFPMASQLEYSILQKFPNRIKNEIVKYSNILAALSDHEDCTWFRANIVENARESNSRILHLPGVDLISFLKFTQHLDIDELLKAALEYKERLSTSSIVEIVTKDNKENEHTLLIPLLSNRKIYMDVGIPDFGEIAQIPCGEVFVAPKEYTANGSIVINGSAPERLFRNNDEVILHFRNGYVDLENSYFSSSRNSQDFAKEIREYSQQDKENIALGEFGIGINPLIKELTGFPIHDEKAQGTVHIALGSNKAFEGKISCHCHIDLILMPYKISIDKKILKKDWGISVQ